MMERKRTIKSTLNLSPVDAGDVEFDAGDVEIDTI